MDVGILQQFTLDWNVMKNWPWFLWALFLGLITLLLSITSYLFYLYSTIGFALIYVGVLVIILGGVWLQGKYLGPAYHLHIHHYFLGMTVTILVCYQNTLLTLVHSIFNGIMIEGGCRWGFSPLWQNDSACNSEQQQRREAILTHLKKDQLRKSNYQAKIKNSEGLKKSKKAEADDFEKAQQPLIVNSADGEPTLLQSDGRVFDLQTIASENLTEFRA